MKLGLLSKKTKSITVHYDRQTGKLTLRKNNAHLHITYFLASIVFTHNILKTTKLNFIFSVKLISILLQCLIMAQTIDEKLYRINKSFDEQKN